MSWAISDFFRRIHRAGTVSSGFTLIEVVISLTLLGFLSGGIFSVVDYAMRLNTAARQVAMNLPQIDAAMESLSLALAGSERILVASGGKYTYTIKGYHEEYVEFRDDKLYIGTDGRDFLLLNNVSNFRIDVPDAEDAVPAYTVFLTALVSEGNYKTYEFKVASRTNAYLSSPAKVCVL